MNNKLDQIENAQGLYSAGITHVDNCQNDFLEISGTLARCHGPVIGILNDEIFRERQMPSDLSPEILADALNNVGGVDVVLLNAAQVLSYEIIARRSIDVLILSYGSSYPISSPNPSLATSAYRRFLDQGGAILITGGIPFGRPFTAAGEDLAKTASGFATPADFYDQWIASAGVKYYRTPEIPRVQQWSREYLPSVSSLDCAGCSLGIVFNNSPRDPMPQPPYGNVFPERIPVCRSIPLLWGEDIAGDTMAINALLLQCYTTGGRIISFAHEESLHPLSPRSSWFNSIICDILTHLTNRIMVKSAAAHYACYRNGEAVEIRSEIVSFERTSDTVELNIEIRHDSRIAWQAFEEIRIGPGETTSRVWKWAPVVFDSDEYDFVVRVKRNGRTVSHAENGFAVWNDTIASKEPSISIQGQFFHVNEFAFIAGTNYYESTGGELMWLQPAVKNILNDLRQMRDSGVNYIRPHFHHPKWFADYLRHQYGNLWGPYEELSNLRGYMPDERVWRIFDLFIYACRKYGLIYGGDLFTLVPEEMGDPRGWYGPTDVFCSREKRAAQKEFLKKLDSRYSEVPGISWDLFNEPAGASPEMLSEWACDLNESISESSPGRLVTIGGPSEYFEGIDYVSPHGKPSQTFINETGRPCFMQELHLDVDEEHEWEQGEQLRRLFVVSVRGGIAGLAPWSWSRQMRLWQGRATGSEKWDDRLGLNTHEDGTLKIAGLVFRDMAAFFRSMQFERFDPESRLTFTLHGKVIGSFREELGVPVCSIYHVDDNDCFGAMDYQKICWAGTTIVSTSANGYVTAFRNQIDPLLAPGRLFIKCDKPGTLKVCTDSKSVEAANLSHIIPGECLALMPLKWKFVEHGIAIDIEPTMERYWIELLLG